MAEPTVQAAYMKQFAGHVRELGAAGEDVFARDPGLLEAIDDAGRLSWLPIALNLRLVDALYDELGRERTRRFLAEQITGQFDTPLWRAFVEGGVRLLGLNPSALVRWVPRAMALIFRDCGAWSVEPDDDGDGATLVGMRVPAVLREHPRWLDSVASGYHALFMLCQTSGETRLETDAHTGEVRIGIRWKSVSG